MWKDEYNAYGLKNTISNLKKRQKHENKKGIRWLDKHGNLTKWSLLQYAQYTSESLRSMKLSQS